MNPAVAISFSELRPKSYIEVALLDGTLLTITGQGLQEKRPPLLDLDTATVITAFLRYKNAEGLTSTDVTYSSILNALTRYEDDWPLTTETVDDFLETYRKNGRSKTTLNEYWTRLNTFFEWSVKHGYTSSNPIRNVPKTQKEKRSVNAVPVKVIAHVFKFIQDTIDQTEPCQPNLVHERGIRDLAVFRLAYSTGIRREGIATLEMNDLFMEKKKVVLRDEADKEGKGGDRFLSYKARICMAD